MAESNRVENILKHVTLSKKYSDKVSIGYSKQQNMNKQVIH